MARKASFWSKLVLYLAAIGAPSRMNVDEQSAARTRSRLVGALRPRPRMAAVVALGAMAVAVASAVHFSAAADAACDRTASPSSLSTQMSAASPGQTICLTDGSYGTWTGTSKAITLRAEPGVTATMAIDLGAGDSGFTLDGLSGMGGTVSAGAHDFVIKNSAFTDDIWFEVANANILLDHNSHDWDADSNSSGSAGKIVIGSDAGDYSGVTIQNSTIRNGDLDGVHIGAGVNVLNNIFQNLCDRGHNHTDNIQFEGAHGGRIAGNYIEEHCSTSTQGLTSYDGQTFGVTIEDNVIDIHRPWGIEFYSDTGSVIRHNTVRWYADADCEYTGTECGQISLDHKTTDPAGTGTQVYDNIATDVNFDDGSTGMAHHNVSGQRAVFEGPLDDYAGFRLAASSPVGLKTASDGLDAGARITLAGGPPATPTPPPDSSSPVAGGPKDGSSRSAPSDLVAAFAFDERAGASVVDAGGAGKLGTIRGAKRTRAGKHRRGLRFDGINDYVKVSDSTKFDLTTGMTLEAWLRPTGFGRHQAGVIAKQRPGRVAYGLFAGHGSPKRLSAQVRVGGGSRVSGARLPLRRWSHVAATYDGTTLRLYRNGKLTASRRVRGGIDASAGHVKIGLGFKGTLDDVRVWRVARSAADIRADSRS